MASASKMLFPTPRGVVEVRTTCAMHGRLRIQRKFYEPADIAEARFRVKNLKQAWPHCATKLIIGR